MFFIPGLKHTNLILPYGIRNGDPCVAMRYHSTDIFFHLKFKILEGSVEEGNPEFITYVEEDFQHEKLILIDRPQLRELFAKFDKLVENEPLVQHSGFLIVYRNKTFYLHGVKLAHQNFNETSRSEVEKWAKILGYPTLPVYWRGEYDRYKMLAFSENTYIQKYESNPKATPQKLIGGN